MRFEISEADSLAFFGDFGVEVGRQAVHRAIAGVRAGRDEILERAIEAVSAADKP